MECKNFSICRTEYKGVYNCAIYTACLNKTYTPITMHGHKKTNIFTFVFSLQGVTKLFRLVCTD